jgi:hypothetical protein
VYDCIGVEISEHAQKKDVIGDVSDKDIDLLARCLFPYLCPLKEVWRGHEWFAA